MKKALLIIPLMLLGLRIAKAEDVTATVANLPGQAYNTTFYFDVSRYDNFAMQVNYEDASFTTDTVSDGAKPYVTITLPATMTNLIGTQASVTLNVASYTAVSDAVIVAGGYRYLEGDSWSVGASSSATATSLAAAINTHPDLSATASGSTVTITAPYGDDWNGTGVTVSTAAALVLSAATLTGGIDRPVVNVNGQTFTEDTDFNFVSSSDTSASNLANAIGANSTIAALFSTSTASNVITLTALYPSQNNYFVSASTTGITVSAWTPGKTSEIDITTNRIYQASHGLTTGLKVLFSTVSAATPPTGLTDQTTYYVIKNGENYYQLSDTSTGAVAGLNIDITDVNGGGSFTIAPIAFSAGSAGFEFKGSNDATNWIDLSLSSVTYSADGSLGQDFSTYNYKYLGLDIEAPTYGGLKITGILSGTR